MRERGSSKYNLNPQKALFDTIKGQHENSKELISPYIVFYKGTVTNNIDPLGKGRLQVRTEFFDRYVGIADLEWFNAGIQGSIYYLPKVGDMVYVSYEDVKNRIGGVWWSYFIRTGQWDWRVDDKNLLIKVKGGSATYTPGTHKHSLLGYPTQAGAPADEDVMIINTTDHIMKFHSQFIIISDLEWEAAGGIPTESFLAFNRNKKQTTIYMDQTYVGNGSMDMHTQIFNSLDLMHKAIKDLKKQYDDLVKKHNTHTHGGVIPGPPYISTSPCQAAPHGGRAFKADKFDIGKWTDWKDTSKEEATDFLTDDSKAD
tara:strand:- start:846 stop:1787 length:942 start_codon:yes stop_codon:yes gene_type:complete